MGLLTKTSGTAAALSGAGEVCCWLVGGKRVLGIPGLEAAGSLLPCWAKRSTEHFCPMRRILQL